MVKFKFISELIPEKSLKNELKSSTIDSEITKSIDTKIINSVPKNFEQIDSLVRFWAYKREIA